MLQVGQQLGLSLEVLPGWQVGIFKSLKGEIKKSDLHILKTTLVCYPGSKKIMKSSFTCHWGIHHPLHPVDTYYLLYQWTVSWFWKRSAKSAKFEWSINRKLLLFLVSGTDRYIFINTLKWSTVWCINCYMFSSASKIRQPLQQQHQRKLASAFRGYNFFLPWLIQVGFCLPNENHPLSMLDYLTVLVSPWFTLTCHHDLDNPGFERNCLRGLPWNLRT